MPVTTPDINAQYEAWAQTDNLWLISMKGGGGGLFEKPDGTTIQMSRGEYLIDPTIPLLKVTVQTELVGWVDDEGNFMSIQDYDANIERLESPARYDDRSDWYEDPIFDNLDDEYAYKKFVKKWTRQNKVETIKTPVTFLKVHEVPRDVNKYIKPMRTVVGDPKNTLFHYDRFSHIQSVICEELGHLYKLEELDRVEFVKVDGKYLSIECKQSDSWLKNSGKASNPLSLTKEQCIAKFQDVDGVFRGVLCKWRDQRATILKDTAPFQAGLTEILTKARAAGFALNGRNKKADEAISGVIREANKLLAVLSELSKFDKLK